MRYANERERVDWKLAWSVFDKVKNSEKGQ